MKWGNFVITIKNYWDQQINKTILMLILISWISSNVYAINKAAKIKFPYALLTEDHGILKEKDLDDGFLKRAPYSPKNLTGQTYWQCFPRSKIDITLRDMGYSAENLSDNDGDLSIIAYEKPGITHRYGMRRHWSIPSTEITFNHWIELMKNEKYVCLAGSGGLLVKEETRNGKNYQEYYWTFEMLKTKKGCDSYFETADCS